MLLSHYLLCDMQISANEKFSKIVEVLRTKTKSEQVVRSHASSGANHRSEFAH